MTKEKIDNLVKIIYKSETFEDLCALAEALPTSDEEIREVLQVIMGNTSTHYTPENISEHEKLRCDFAIFKQGYWKSITGSIIEEDYKLFVLQVQTGSVKWDPYIFSDEETAKKFFERNKRAETREYQIVLDMQRQLPTLGASSDIMHMNWDDNYTLKGRPLL